MTARAGDQLAEVGWTAPTPDDPAITGYTITSSPADTPPVTVDPTARTATVTGLTNGTAYTFTVAATNPDGTSHPRTPQPRSPPARPPPPPSPWPPARPASSTAAPSSCPAASSRPPPPRASPTNRSPSSGAPKGGTTWTALAALTTGSDGTLHPTQAVTPQASTDYRLRHPATPFYAASTIPTVTVRVGVRLTARSNRTHMALGRTATISGQVVPTHTGQRIRLQHKQGRTWRSMQSKTLPASDRYYFNLRPRATGTSWWRVYKASDPDHIGGISRTFRLVVYRAAITGIHADAAGDDRRNRNGEFVLVRNTGAAAINLAGWKLDAGDRGQRFSLASYPLKKGATVRIHTGRGTTKAGHLYLGSGRPIWNNDGDTATLIDPHNIAVSRYRY